MIAFDTRDLAALAVDLDKIGFKATGVLIDTFEEAGDHLVKTWANNARETSGTHGKLYPDAIDKERLISGDIVIEVGPNPAKPQGGMSFEYGSVNSPPHLDGQRAADSEIPVIDARIQRALTFLGL